MRTALLTLIFVFVSLSGAVHGLPGRPHEFRPDECRTCHVDEKNYPARLTPAVNVTCLNCHPESGSPKSHPVDIYPYDVGSVPDDLPLYKRKITCMTCHLAHPLPDGKTQVQLLRGNAGRSMFCLSCHRQEKKNHIDLGTAHMNPKSSSDTAHRLDRMSVLCMECHPGKISDRKSAPALFRFICSSSLNHPVGISFDGIRGKKARQIRNENMLSPDIKLFNGKIGCLTCHNIYSVNRKLLVMDNRKSRLCLECHIK